MAIQSRQRISEETCQCLVRAFNDPEQDYLAVADTLGIHPSMARGIIKRYLDEHRIEGATSWEVIT